MAVPSGYTPLAKVGMVNKGTYSASATYNNLDFVYYNGSSYVAKKDGLTGVTPADGANWQYLAKGFLNADATGINIKDTCNLMGSGAGKAVTLQTWGDKIADWLVSKVITNDNFVTKLTERLVNNGTTTSTGFALDARYGKTLQDAVSQLNADVATKIAASLAQKKAVFETQHVTNTEPQVIGSEDTVLWNADFTPSRSGLAVITWHLTFQSASARAALYWIVNGIYLQGIEQWDGAKNNQKTLDIVYVGSVTAGTLIRAQAKDLNKVGDIKSIGNNTSLNRTSFLLFPTD